MAEAEPQIIPLYGFREGDTLGLLILAYPDDRISELADKLEASAGIRVPPLPSRVLVHNGRRLDNDLTVRNSGLKALDRFDVVRPEHA